MAEFYGIITNFGSSPKATAYMEVAVDTLANPSGGPVPVLFNVFKADGTQLAEFTVSTNANGLASSASGTEPNLFKIAGGLPALVKATTPELASIVSAVLHQREQGSRLSIGLPRARRSEGLGAQGQTFSVPVGDLTSAALLVANVSGFPAVVDVFVGTKGASGQGVHTVPNLPASGVARIDLAAGDRSANLVVSSTVDIVLQLLIDDGRVGGVTCVPA